MKRIKLDTDIKESDRLNCAFVGACEAGDKKIVEMVLPWVKRNGVNCSDSLGVTGLMAALVADQYDVGGLLLDLPGMDLTVRDNDGRTVLDYLLKSKSLFYFEEIIEKLSRILTTEEVSGLILIKLTECLPELKEQKNLFSRLLWHYNINYKSGELFNRALKYAGESTILAVESILQDLDILKLTPDNVTALVAATAAGHSGLIGIFLMREGLLDKKLDMKKFLKMCREKGVKDNIVNRELYQALSYMIEEDLCMEMKSTFDIGLELLDINYQDEDGVTILMQVVQSIHNLGSNKVLKVVEKILKMDQLDINLMTANGESSLDFLRFRYYNKLSLVFKAQDTSLHHLSPVINRNSCKKVIPECIMKTFPLDVQVLNLFKERQDIFKDLDFNFVKNSLLAQATAAERLDLVRFLIINCNVKVLQSDFEEWETSVQWKQGELKEGVSRWGEVKNVLTHILKKIAEEDLQAAEEIL
eukprot:GFUD01111957.1.p1 GENE.GFUD01111957.1~~GFUD01111957.1.p1  ORF type:complete len:473 (+),score=101.56 GFUD01111957.1:105-1523(+)